MKIYDCFTFFNEKEMLKFRIEYLKDIVDYFVIVEAKKTFTNKDKEQNFSYDFFDEETRKKIKYFYLDFPEDNILDYLDFKADFMIQTEEGLKTWSREFFQRNSLTLGLSNAEKNDIILISDVDEIFNKKALQYLKDNNNIFNEYKLISLKQIPFYYNISNPFMQSPTQKVEAWYHPKATIYEIVQKNKPNILRMSQPAAVIENGGWHFGYFGGNDRVKIKHQSTSIHHDESLVTRSEITLKNKIEVSKIYKNNIEEIKKNFEIPDLVFSDKYKNFFLKENNNE